MARKAKAEKHGLAKGEQVVGEAVRDGQRIVVTDQGRKVVVDAEGGVIERLTGPAYDWESGATPAPEVAAEEPTEETAEGTGE